MALTQPILNNIPAFDATQSYTFTFEVLSGTQVAGNRLVIKNNETGVTIYDNTTATYVLSHTVPANTMVNGNYYNVTVYTMDSTMQNFSIPSAPVAFYCYTEPTLNITNITEGQTITQASYSFTGQYSQIQGELLNGWQFILYDNTESQISSSPIFYDTEIEYDFAGFNNNVLYYIELIGTTVNNTSITTGLISFNVAYVQPPNFSIVDLSNNCNEGNIQINSNIVAIDGVSNPNPPIYIDDEKVNLKEDGSWVKWDTGYNISDDFTMRVWGEDYNDNSNLITMTNNQNTNENPHKIMLDTITVNEYDEGNVVSDAPNSNSLTGNPIVINNTVDSPLKDINIEGKTYQNTRSGKNKLQPNTAIARTFNGLAWAMSANGNVTITGTATSTYSQSTIAVCDVISAGTYKFVAPDNYGVWLYNNSNTLLTTLKNGNTATITENATKYALFIEDIVSGQTYNISYNPMLMLSSETNTDYEQYGASPSPTYPSMLENVGSNMNLAKLPAGDSLSVSGVTCQVTTDTNNNSQYIYLNGNLVGDDVVTIQVYPTLSGSSSTIATQDIVFHGGYYTARSNYISGSINYENNLSVNLADTIATQFNLTGENNFTQIKGYEYGTLNGYNRMYLQISPGTIFNGYTIGIKLEPGLVNHEYTLPEATIIDLQTETNNGGDVSIYTLPTPSELLGLVDELKDKIYKSTNKWYLEKQIGTIILDGTERWSTYTSYTGEGYCYYYENSDFALSSISSVDYVRSLCSHFTNVYSVWSFSTSKIGTYSDHPTSHRKYFITDKSTVALFKEWLTNNPVTLQYLKDAPVTTEITDTNFINTLESVKTKTGSTTIKTTDVINPNLNVIYYTANSGIYQMLRCWSGNRIPYMITSNFIPIPATTDRIFTWIRKKNNIFDLKIENLGRG